MKYSLLQKILTVLLIILSGSVVQSADKKKALVNLRPYCKILSLSEAEEMANVLIREKNGTRGFFGHSTINHDYDVNTIEDEKVVIDNATGLMWHQSGSYNNISWKSAKKWVGELNTQAYAGFTDWRLPTLEEAVSLLESSEKHDNQFIDPVFDKTQWSIWTCDSSITDGSLSLDRAWSVNFNHGLIGRNNIMADRKKVRPVRVRAR
ncbi:MAG: DUF1566 domain-containing protein [Candidatus Brocadiaceae bacterium]|nr:DUF1566 domain-containing protein [Candidatus Brocadiaceae bacterium]